MDKPACPPCPTCKGTVFFPIPDSLALACEGCGFVWVMSNQSETGYEPGTTLQQWVEDVYGGKRVKGCVG